MTRPVAIVVPSAAGLATARRIAQSLPGAELHGRAGRVADADCVFPETIAHLRALFAEGTAIIGVCAAGILIRALAPLLAEKQDEPPVLAVSGDGASVVPLLGGHHGANALARRIAQALQAHAAITSAGDIALGLALDEPPPGWRLANPERAGAVAASLLAGDKARLVVEAGNPAWLAPLADAPSLPLPRDTGEGRSGGDTADILVTDRVYDPVPRALIYHPPVLALGVGCERGTDPGELAKLVADGLESRGLAAGAVACLASIDLKMDEPALLELARALDLPARFFSAAELEAETPRLCTPSDAVFRATGCHGVAEGAALAAASAESELVLAKTRSARATCAIARARGGIDPIRVGRARGRLSIVGLGPGARVWRSPEASKVLAEATDIVGYRGYFALMQDVASEASRHAFALGEEAERARHALDLAAAGRRVALIGSGDAGIYGMASLVLEEMARAGRADWNRIELDFCPGISALQAAAARAGAPLGHDFCAISLSDLLTPWPMIERRLRAAGEADFVIALYNPASAGRRRPLASALALLRQFRPAATPVIAAHDLGRAEERVEIATLAEFDPAKVDMTTLLLIGSNTTRHFADGRRRWVYTPRGYADKGTR